MSTKTEVEAPEGIESNVSELLFEMGVRVGWYYPYIDSKGNGSIYRMSYVHFTDEYLTYGMEVPESKYCYRGVCVQGRGRHEESFPHDEHKLLFPTEKEASDALKIRQIGYHQMEIARLEQEMN